MGLEFEQMVEPDGKHTYTHIHTLWHTACVNAGQMKSVNYRNAYREIRPGALANELLRVWNGEMHFLALPTDALTPTETTTILKLTMIFGGSITDAFTGPQNQSLDGFTSTALVI